MIIYLLKIPMCIKPGVLQNLRMDRGSLLEKQHNLIQFKADSQRHYGHKPGKTEKQQVYT